MKLWKLVNLEIKQRHNVNHAMIIAADTEDIALYLSFVVAGIYESRPWAHSEPEWRDYYYNRYYDGPWTEKPEIKLLAEHTYVEEEGLVCSSFIGRTT